MDLGPGDICIGRVGHVLKGRKQIRGFPLQVVNVKIYYCLQGAYFLLVIIVYSPKLLYPYLTLDP